MRNVSGLAVLAVVLAACSGENAATPKDVKISSPVPSFGSNVVTLNSPTAVRNGFDSPKHTPPIERIKFQGKKEADGTCSYVGAPNRKNLMRVPVEFDNTTCEIVFIFGDWEKEYTVSNRVSIATPKLSDKQGFVDCSSMPSWSDPRHVYSSWKIYTASTATAGATLTLAAQLTQDSYVYVRIWPVNENQEDHCILAITAAANNTSIATYTSDPSLSIVSNTIFSSWVNMQAGGLSGSVVHKGGVQIYKNNCGSGETGLRYFGDNSNLYRNKHFTVAQGSPYVWEDFGAGSPGNNAFFYFCNGNSQAYFSELPSGYGEWISM